MNHPFFSVVAWNEFADQAAKGSYPVLGLTPQERESLIRRGIIKPAPPKRPANANSGAKKTSTLTEEQKHTRNLALQTAWRERNIANGLRANGQPRSPRKVKVMWPAASGKTQDVSRFMALDRSSP